MTVDIKIPTVMQKLTAGERTVSAAGDTVGAVVAALEARYPGFQAQVVDADGVLHRYVNIYLNDEDIRFLGKLDAPVTDGDVLQILPALAGGCGCMCMGASR